MRIGSLLTLLAILGALLAAALLHEELTGDARREAEAAERAERSGHVLDLVVGGDAPILVLQGSPAPGPEPSPGPGVEPGPGPEPAPGPRDEPAPADGTQTVFLPDGKTISHLCQQYLGSPKRYREVLELNGWTEEQATHLKAGTPVKMPLR
ncbi:MAG: hypothetical protein R3F30_13265 [Planctomycetota bacterium]